MSKDKHIDNISKKVWEAYYSGVILTSDKERVDAFLKQYPEFEEEFKAISPEDALVINKITESVNSRIESQTKSKKSPLIWIGAVATVAIIVVVALNIQNDASIEVANNDIQKKVVAPADSAEKRVVEVVPLMEETFDDTMFFFERKGGDVEVEELVVEVKKEVFPEILQPVIERDTGFVVGNKEIDKVEVEREVYKKSFATSVDYRQTVYVEDNFYSQSKTMGKTTSYASPIKGYTYEMEGMPNFRGSDEELISYINDKLSSDELLSGIRRKMRANLSFVITNKGKVKDVLVQNCNHKQFGMSLMDIMENIPDWNPSEFKGKKGKAHYVLKITFE